MILHQTIQQAANTFSRHNIADGYLEARVLLGQILELSSAELFTQPELTLNQGQIKIFNQSIERRINNEPTAYIIKHKEFFGIDFYVDHRVLIPRPETELLVEEALEFARSKINHTTNPSGLIQIADIGTGCGAIAISIALNLPHVKVLATDISPLALEVARLNSDYHKVTGQVTFLQGNLLEPIHKPVDLIIANLPYIKTSELPELSPEITGFEPEIAINGGESGLDPINQILEQIKERELQQCRLLLEIGQGQEQQVTALVNRLFPAANPELVTDLNGINRVVKMDI